METTEIVPRSPLNLYINLYCNKRQLLDNNVKKDNKLLKEATKSWLSLNDTEKQAICMKYDKILVEYKQKIADSLKKVKPYLRKRNHKQNKTSKNNDIQGQGQIEANLNKSKENTNTSFHGDTDNKMMSTLRFTEPQELPSNINEQSKVNQHGLQGTLPEPIPPNVMSGKELYVLLSTNTENSRNWESLQRTEKNYYSTAVRTIKSNYIKAYRSFLENLGPRELYDYYINNKEME